MTKSRYVLANQRSTRVIHLLRGNVQRGEAQIVRPISCRAGQYKASRTPVVLVLTSNMERRLTETLEQQDE